jgi:heavy metal sensor kinase
MLIEFIKKMPVRLRLSVGHATCMAILYVAIGAGIYKVMEKSLYESVDTALITSARSVRDARFTWGVTPGREEAMDHFLKNPLQVNQLIGARYIRPFAQIINTSGKIHSKTNNVHVPLPVTPRSISRAEKGLWSFETFHMKKDAQLRQVTLPIMEHGKFTGEIIQVGASLRHTLDTLNGITLMLFTILPSLLVISILLGYILTARALKPVENISSAAAKLGIDDLSIRLPLPAGDDELRILSLTFNSMLDRLEDAVKRLRRFTGDVSHELRTPLAVIRGESELALRRERSSEEYQRSLTSITKEAKNMTVIIEDLLLLARAESKSVAMNWETVQIHDFVGELVAQLQKFYAARSVTLVSHIENIETLSCAQGFLTIALKNILSNAAKHSVPGSTVHFTVRNTGNHAEFLIQDEGEGIPQDSIPYIFDPFFRADTARNRATGGVGIGLSLALALVKLHQGSIKVFANEPKGTTFQALIPC